MLISLALLVACSDYSLAKQDPGLDGAVDVEEAFVVVTETETTPPPEDDEPDEEVAEEPIEDCLPNTAFVVYDEEGDAHTVPAYLEFRLNSGSRSGTVSDGYEHVLTVDATAHCATVVLEHVLLITSTDGDDIGWLAAVLAAMSGISYEWDRMAVFSGYGRDHAEPPDSSMTAVMWDHEFVMPITIPRNETFSFTLGVEFGDGVEPTDTFSFRLYPRYTWYGEGDPSAYPDPVVSTDVDGHELTYAPS